MVKRIIRRQVVIEVVEVWTLVMRDTEVVAEKPAGCQWQLQVTDDIALAEEAQRQRCGDAQSAPPAAQDFTCGSSCP
jgi:hypothetical protein